ncbi:hypothetical protein [Streptomyces nigrescens]
MQIDTIVVEENEPDECFTVGMAEGEEGRQLIIQTALYEPDDQGQQLGLDTYCVMDESGATHYSVASDAGQEAAARALARRMLAGELTPQEFTFRIHRRYGHELP